MPQNSQGHPKQENLGNCHKDVRSEYNVRF